VGGLPHEVTLRAGAEKTLRLPSQAGAGYRWEASVEDETIVGATIRFEDAVTGAGGRTAFSRDELLMLSGRRAGATSVRCIQRRGWEHDTPPLEDHRLTVKVVAAVRDEPIEKEATSEH
jgi:predicted secreted protein